MGKESIERLDRVANYIFLEFCGAGENTILESYYGGGLDLVESLIDGEKK